MRILLHVPLIFLSLIVVGGAPRAHAQEEGDTLRALEAEVVELPDLNFYRTEVLQARERVKNFINVYLRHALSLEPNIADPITHAVLESSNPRAYLVALSAFLKPYPKVERNHHALSVNEQVRKIPRPCFRRPSLKKPSVTLSIVPILCSAPSKRSNTHQSFLNI